ncbi:MAG: hypothetical protein AAFV45_00220 [Pseudomonadota bacterium]
MLRRTDLTDQFTPRVDAADQLHSHVADRLVRLDQHLRRHGTATAGLLAWCLAHDIGSGPIVAEVVSSFDARTRDGSAVDTRPKSAQQSASEPRFLCSTRCVNLRRGPILLSRAQLIYRHTHLPNHILETLAASDIPFGKLIAGLRPQRRTTASKMKADLVRLDLDATHPDGGPFSVLEHHATVYIHGNHPIARVREAYTSALLTSHDVNKLHSEQV